MWWGFYDAKIWALAAMPLWLSESHSIVLYFDTTHGSQHWRCQAGSCSIATCSMGHMHWAGISSHSAWWLLSTASPNARYPDLQCLMRLIGRKMSLMGVLLLLCMAGECRCSVVGLLARQTACSMTLIGFFWTSSFMSAVMMTVLPSAYHSIIALARSARKVAFGKSMWSFFARYQPCCW